MNCSDYRDRLSSYVDGALEPAKQAELQAHLSSCVGCGQELKALKDMLQALRAMAPPQVPDLLPGIHKRLQPVAWWQLFAMPWPVSLPWHGLALATTALLVVLVMRQRPVELARYNETNGLRSSFDQIADLKEADTAVPVEPLAKIARLADESFDKKKDERMADSFKTAAAMPQPAFEEPQRLAQAASPASFNGFDNRPDNSARGGASVLTVASEVGFGGSGPAQYPRDAIDSLEQGASTVERALDANGFLASRLGREEKIMEQLFGDQAKAREIVPLGSSVSALGFQPSQTASNSSAPDLLQMRLQTDNIDETVSRVAAWAEAHQGFATLTTPEHLSVILPGSFVAEFIQEFFSNAPLTYTADASAAWVTISIDLISSQ